jgi:hypothetical protein
MTAKKQSMKDVILSDSEGSFFDFPLASASYFLRSLKTPVYEQTPSLVTDHALTCSQPRMYEWDKVKKQRCRPCRISLHHHFGTVIINCRSVLPQTFIDKP